MAGSPRVTIGFELSDGVNQTLREVDSPSTSTRPRPSVPFFALFSGDSIHELLRLVFLFISVSSDSFNMVVEVSKWA